MWRTVPRRFPAQWCRSAARRYLANLSPHSGRGAPLRKPALRPVLEGGAADDGPRGAARSGRAALAKVNLRFDGPAPAKRCTARLVRARCVLYSRARVCSLHQIVSSVIQMLCPLGFWYSIGTREPSSSRPRLAETAPLCGTEPTEKLVVGCALRCGLRHTGN